MRADDVDRHEMANRPIKSNLRAAVETAGEFLVRRRRSTCGRAARDALVQSLRGECGLPDARVIGIVQQRIPSAFILLQSRYLRFAPRGCASAGTASRLRALSGSLQASVAESTPRNIRIARQHEAPGLRVAMHGTFRAQTVEKAWGFSLKDGFERRQVENIGKRSLGHGEAMLEKPVYVTAVLNRMDNLSFTGAVRFVLMVRQAHHEGITLSLSKGEARVTCQRRQILFTSFCGRRMVPCGIGPFRFVDHHIRSFCRAAPHGPVRRSRLQAAVPQLPGCEAGPGHQDRSVQRDDSFRSRNPRHSHRVLLFSALSPNQAKRRHRQRSSR